MALQSTKYTATRTTDRARVQRAYEAAVDGSTSEGSAARFNLSVRLHGNVARGSRILRKAAFGDTGFPGSEVGGTSEGGHRTGSSLSLADKK